MDFQNFVQGHALSSGAYLSVKVGFGPMKSFYNGRRDQREANGNFNKHCWEYMKVMVKVLQNILKLRAFVHVMWLFIWLILWCKDPALEK